ncbi:unnamed protein product, partial [Strongylus vulgaris]
MDVDVTFVNVNLVLFVNVKMEGRLVYANRKKRVDVKLERKDVNVPLTQNVAANHCVIVKLLLFASVQRARKAVDVTFVNVSQMLSANAEMGNLPMQFATVNLYVSVKREPLANAQKTRRDAFVTFVNVSLVLFVNVKMEDQLAYANRRKCANARPGRKDVNVPSMQHATASPCALVNLVLYASARKAKRDVNVKFVSVSQVQSADVRMGSLIVYVNLTKCVSAKLGRKDANVDWTKTATASHCVFVSLAWCASVQKGKKDANAINVPVIPSQCADAKVVEQLVSVIQQQLAIAKQEKKGVSAKLVLHVSVSFCVLVNQTQFANVNQIKKVANVRYACVNKAAFAPAKAVNPYVFVIPASKECKCPAAEKQQRSESVTEAAKMVEETKVLEQKEPPKPPEQPKPAEQKQELLVPPKEPKPSKPEEEEAPKASEESKAAEQKQEPPKPVEDLKLSEQKEKPPKPPEESKTPQQSIEAQEKPLCKCQPGAV